MDKKNLNCDSILKDSLAQNQMIAQTVEAQLSALIEQNRPQTNRDINSAGTKSAVNTARSHSAVSVDCPTAVPPTCVTAHSPYDRFTSPARSLPDLADTSACSGPTSLNTALSPATEMDGLRTATADRSRPRTVKVNTNSVRTAASTRSGTSFGKNGSSGKNEKKPSFSAISPAVPREENVLYTARSATPPEHYAGNVPRVSRMKDSYYADPVTPTNRAKTPTAREQWAAVPSGPSPKIRAAKSPGVATARTPSHPGVSQDRLLTAQQSVRSTRSSGVQTARDVSRKSVKTAKSKSPYEASSRTPLRTANTSTPVHTSRSITPRPHLNTAVRSSSAATARSIPTTPRGNQNSFRAVSPNVLSDRDRPSMLTARESSVNSRKSTRPTTPNRSLHTATRSGSAATARLIPNTSRNDEISGGRSPDVLSDTTRPNLLTARQPQTLPSEKLISPHPFKSVNEVSARTDINNKTSHITLDSVITAPSRARSFREVTPNVHTARDYFPSPPSDSTRTASHTQPPTPANTPESHLTTALSTKSSRTARSIPTKTENPSFTGSTSDRSHSKTRFSTRTAKRDGSVKSGRSSKKGNRRSNNTKLDDSTKTCRSIKSIKSFKKRTATKSKNNENGSVKSGRSSKKVSRRSNKTQLDGSAKVCRQTRPKSLNQKSAVEKKTGNAVQNEETPNITARSTRAGKARSNLNTAMSSRSVRKTATPANNLYTAREATIRETAVAGDARGGVVQPNEILVQSSSQNGRSARSAPVSTKTIGAISPVVSSPMEKMHGSGVNTARSARSQKSASKMANSNTTTAKSTAPRARIATDMQSTRTAREQRKSLSTSNARTARSRSGPLSAHKTARNTPGPLPSAHNNDQVILTSELPDGTLKVEMRVSVSVAGSGTLELVGAPPTGMITKSVAVNGHDIYRQ